MSKRQRLVTYINNTPGSQRRRELKKAYGHLGLPECEVWAETENNFERCGTPIRPVVYVDPCSGRTSGKPGGAKYPVALSRMYEVCWRENGYQVGRAKPVGLGVEIMV